MYSVTCTWFNSWGCRHCCSEMTWGVMGYSCVNKHGMFAQGQSFGRNVILNCRDCRWRMHSPGSGRPQLHFGAHIFKEGPCHSKRRVGEKAVMAPKGLKKGGWTSSLLTPHQSHLWLLQFRWRSLFPPPVSWGRRKKRANAGDQRGIDWVYCSRIPAEQSLLLLWPLSNAEVEATALLGIKELHWFPNFHMRIHKTPEIDLWFYFTFPVGLLLWKGASKWINCQTTTNQRMNKTQPCSGNEGTSQS